MTKHWRVIILSDNANVVQVVTAVTPLGALAKVAGMLPNTFDTAYSIGVNLLSERGKHND